MPKKFQKGLFALSADPITYGHLATIKLALKQCQKLVVLVANNEEKKSAYTFSLAKRFALTKQAVVQANLTGVQVVVSSGLLTDVFMKEGCDVVFRGIRHEYDYSYEVEKSKLYAHIYPAVKKRFVFLTTPEKYSHVSSSWVKDFVKMGVNVAPYVPLFIKQALEEKMCGQIKIGVTGTLGSGKSFVARQLIGALQKKKIKAYHIVLDDLLHKLYAEDSEGAQTIRQDLAKKFGTRVLSKDKKTVNRAQLAQKLFAEVRNKKTVEWAQTLVYPQVERLLREEI
ncbi:MAG: pantetheine-phosphate adenylyltransferase, partial [Candidatus Kerfeldbacteria bacterium RIFOXYC2_FULL_38_9]